MTSAAISLAVRGPGRPLRRERAAWMQGIPVGPRLVVAAASRRMDAKSLNEAVPDRLVVPDQHRFPKRDPDVIHNQEPAQKVGQLGCWSDPYSRRTPQPV